MSTKFILVTGGVLSGIGKGVVASSTGMLLRSCGIRVTSIKIDPYLNVDAGTMSPFEHGEVFILDDGGEVDLDLGNYERFVDLTLQTHNNITTGKIYHSVIQKERRGDYLGKTVQVVPHICNEIQEWVEKVSTIPTDGSDHKPQVCVIELGGTVGDIESMPFIEAMRQFEFRVGKSNMCVIHVSLVPVVGAVGEHKTKPTQQSVKELRAQGLHPDLIVCRSSTPLDDKTKEKISSFCMVPTNAVIGVHDVSNLYRVPLLLKEQGFAEKLFEILSLEEIGTPRAVLRTRSPSLESWGQMAEQMDRLIKMDTGVRIVIAGKYTGLGDSYLSVVKGLNHASLHTGIKVYIDWIETENLEIETQSTDPEKYHNSWEVLKRADGILVPGGFGVRGLEGKVLAAKFARENKIPYFGICLGLQVSVIEFARNVLGWETANSEEFSEDGNHVVIFMPEISKTHMGGTMRLGTRKTIVKDHSSILPRLYKEIWKVGSSIDERHRHRYEVNPKVVQQLEDHGFHFVGQDESGQRQEMAELCGHPYYVGVQYHPEMKTRPRLPSPPFVGLVLAASGQLEAFLNGTSHLVGLFKVH
eukprot:TRINITY_DN3586_c0_g1_i3.p1 TRINITY_DN3586_c0_g1~~TRINITY_DN3586_c0_g1_i3.p1  ORF type:complete len:584 (+),score=122.18 TRINITY_DN3586_c0_g1_i3:95-1846(+)